MNLLSSASASKSPVDHSTRRLLLSLVMEYARDTGSVDHG
jgi:hypothetical protein